MYYTPGITDFYYPYLTKKQIKKLESVKPTDLQPEIDLMRSLIVMRIEDYKKYPPKTFGEKIEFLLDIGKYFLTVGQVIHTHIQLNPPMSKYQDIIDQALDEAREELGVNGDWSPECIHGDPVFHDDPLAPIQDEDHIKKKNARSGASSP